MTIPGVHFLRLLAGMAFAATLVATSGTGVAQQAAPPADEDWHFRYELFQMLLEQNGVQPGHNVRDVVSHPSESIIVMLGSMNLRTSRFLETFCEQGGAVLLATDESYSAGRICEFRGGPVTTRVKSDRYQDYSDCLTIRNIDDDHPLMDGVNSLVVARTGWLAPPKWFIPDYQVAATLPSRTWPRDSAQQPLLATVGRPRGNTGQLIIASDPRLFTNGMLWHGDNAILAINICKALCVGNKTRLLFIADGTSLGSFKHSPMVNPANIPPLPDNLPQPTMETYFQIANTVLKEMEDQNVLNQVIADRPNKLRPSFLRRSILFSIAIAALAFIIWKLTAANSTTHSAMPIREMKSAHDMSTGQKVKSAEFGLSASILARELCCDLTGSSDPADWRRLLAENAATGCGSIEFHKVPDAATRRIQIANVLDLAVNTQTVHISRKRFEFLGKSILQLRQLHNAGCLVIPERQASTT